MGWWGWGDDAHSYRDLEPGAWLVQTMAPSVFVCFPLRDAGTKVMCVELCNDWWTSNSCPPAPDRGLLGARNGYHAGQLPPEGPRARVAARTLEPHGALWGLMELTAQSAVSRASEPLAAGCWLGF